MPVFKDKPCKICGTVYTPIGPCSYYCSKCAEEQRKLSNRKRELAYRKRKGCLVGVGKGGATHSGKLNPMWKGGVASIFASHRKEMRASIKVCEWCGKDLAHAGRYEWCVHHLDHNRKNNDRSNLVMLCKRCHQVHHECIKALIPESATTISKESTPKQVEAHDNPLG